MTRGRLFIGVVLALAVPILLAGSRPPPADPIAPRYLYTTLEGTSSGLWSSTGPRRLAQIPHRDGYGIKARLSPDGSRLAYTLWPPGDATTPAELRQFLTLGKELGLVALVEVHRSVELEQALEAGAALIGVNNRDLKTFAVSVETSLQLIESIPEECVAVSESGLASATDLERLRAAGFDAFLIGERLMQASDPGAALRNLLASVRE